MTGRFLKVKCGKCNKEQVIFEKAAGKVECLGCGEVLAEPAGGKARIKATVLEVVR